MRAPACALAALAFAIALSGSALAQSYGQPDDGYRSSPPPYFTDRPPSRGPEHDGDRPPSRSTQDAPWPPVTRSGEPQRPPDEWVGDGRSRPSEERIVRKPPVPTYRHVEPAPPPSEGFRNQPDERDGRRVIVTTKPPPPRPPAVREPDGPGSRVMIGPNEIVISIAEYEDLRKQSLELKRLLGRQSGQGDERRGTTTYYR
jgi:hypothetical protein